MTFEQIYYCEDCERHCILEYITDGSVPSMCPIVSNQEAHWKKGGIEGAEEEQNKATE